MSSFSDWCDLGESELRRAQQEAASPRVYPRLANYDCPEPPPEAEREIPAPAGPEPLAGRTHRATSANIEAPERWDSLW